VFNREPFSYACRMRIEPADVYLRKLGKRIRELREAKGLTQEDFDDGTRLGITARGLQEIEYGNNNAKIYTLYKIARRLGVNVGDLLDFK